MARNVWTGIEKKILAEVPVDAVQRPKTLAEAMAEFHNRTVAETEKQLADISDKKLAQAVSEAISNAILEASITALGIRKTYDGYELTHYSDSPIAKTVRSMATEMAEQLVREVKDSIPPTIIESAKTGAAKEFANELKSEARRLGGWEARRLGENLVNGAWKEVVNILKYGHLITEDPDD